MAKEVKKQFLLDILNLVKEGKNPTQISTEKNISKQKLNYYIRELKELGYIKRVGYGVWEVKNKPSNTLTINKEKEIRGHAFIWVLKLNEKIDWNSKIKGINYKLIRGKIPRLIINNRKIWLGKRTLTIYEPHSFYGINAIESRKYAVISLFEVLEELEKKLKVNLKPYMFKPAREHYGIIKNDLAQQCNRKGEKIHIIDNLDGEWLWVDDSLSIGELETGGKGISKDRVLLNLEVQNWWNDNKQHNFKVTPTFLLESLNAITNIQQREAEKWNEYARDIVEHKEAIKTLSEQVKLFVEEVKKLREEKNG